MVKIKPFKGIRPPKELASEVASVVLAYLCAPLEASKRSLSTRVS